MVMAVVMKIFKMLVSSKTNISCGKTVTHEMLVSSKTNISCVKQLRMRQYGYI